MIGAGNEIPLNRRAKFVPDEAYKSHPLMKKLWDGAIPLKIELARSDHFAPKLSPSVYIMAPRQNYLFFILNQV